MKRARLDEPNVWPSKRVVASSSNANARWPLATQPARPRGSTSLLLPNGAPVAVEHPLAAAIPAAREVVPLPQLQAAAASAKLPEKNELGNTLPPTPVSPPKIVRNSVIEGNNHQNSKDVMTEMRPLLERKTYPPENKYSEIERLLNDASETSSPSALGNVTAAPDMLNGTTDDLHHDIPGALAFMIEQEAEVFNLNIINSVFSMVAAGAVSLWILLVAAMFMVTPREHVVYLEPSERSSATLAGTLLLLVMSSKVLPVCLSGGRKAFSGVLIGALVIQCIAMTTNFLMALFKVPVMVDPITGSRVFLLRWCEWTPLAFAMTFFTEGVDAFGLNKPPDTKCSRKTTIAWYWRTLKMPILLSLSQGVSTICGLIFPFCPGIYSWTVTMVISCVLYVILFPRLYWQRQRLMKASKRRSSDDVDRYDRIQLSYRLLFTCTSCWTLLVAFYFLGAFANTWAPPGTIWASSSFPFFCDTLMDVIAKAFYMDVIVDVHKLMFDETSRVTRRLEELRRMMAVVWDCSSDVIALSMRCSNGTVTTMISPTFHKIEQCSDDESAPIVFEIEASELDVNADDSSVDSKGVYFLDVDVMSSGTVSARKYAVNLTEHPGFFCMRNLVRRGWAISSNEQTLLNDLKLSDKPVVHCETKATRLGPNALILVMRDISERCRRFEAEKVAVSESTARRKDEEANRFTRHEVKNGLLASIGLCDSLREAISEETGRVIDRSSSGSLSNLRLMSMLESNKREKWKDPLSLSRKQSGQDGLRRLIMELDLTLRDILDTVLAEAMARDVIHEVYRPKLERVDFSYVLGGGDGDASATNRFPIVTDPCPLPLFLFDLQLLKYIHRNAVSNACKYGKKGGVVLTEIRYFSQTNEIQMNVINLPGENHGSILAMGSAAASAVFAAGKRLGVNNDMSEATASHSSGDGAWISRKCAKTLGGSCGIRFEPNRTVFTLRCPATRYDVASGVPANFSLPENTWGIAIDDSKIQRKMLQRFFSVAGIKKKQQVLLGKTPMEIRGFNQTVIDLVKQHPEDYFLLIVDENLDIIAAENHTEHTISGSLTIQKLRKDLGPQAEARVLAVVRSANDSATDIEVYNARAHGFLYKAPIQKEKIMEVLAPLWVKRFERFPDSVDVGKECSSVNERKVEPEADDFVSAATDVMETLEVIDALCMEDEAYLNMRWSLILKKLQSLKHELQTLERSEIIDEALISINKMHGPTIPDEFLSKWASLRSLIIRVV